MILVLRQFFALFLSITLAIPVFAKSTAIASDPGGINGAVNYTYDSVGNRKQLTSTLAAVPAGLWNYDANDRFTAGDTYDANGNTTSSGGIGNVYDFENHLIQKGGVTIVYDGDGNRVAKTVAGVMTRYLVDVKNPTGYAQVIAEEFASTANSAVYVYGLERISKAYYSDQFAGPRGFRYYVYGGHGSVRALADTSGNVTDTYDYDAFGVLIHSTFTSIPPLATTVSPSPNNYLYSGEQFDPDLNLYYNRARYLNVGTGRFWTMDSFEGIRGEPFSLHKYLYASADPINRFDRSGHDDLNTLQVAQADGIIVRSISTISTVTVQFLVRRLLTVSAFLGAGFFAASNPEIDVEVQAGGQEAITAVQNAFLETENVITEVQAEEGSIWNSYGTLRDYFNELFTGGRASNPPNIEYHHIVEQVEEEVNGFSSNAINSTANVIPTPAQVHQAITTFYSEAQVWLNGQSVRGWMTSQSWEVQWRQGLEIWKQAMTGAITWRPPTL